MCSKPMGKHTGRKRGRFEREENEELDSEENEDSDEGSRDDSDDHKEEKDNQSELARSEHSDFDVEGENEEGSVGFDVDDDQETVIVEEDDNAADTEISVPSKKRSPAKPKAATDSCNPVDDQVGASSLLVFFCTQLHLLHSCVCGYRHMQWLHP